MNMETMKKNGVAGNVYFRTTHHGPKDRTNHSHEITGCERFVQGEALDTVLRRLYKKAAGFYVVFAESEDRLNVFEENREDFIINEN